MSRDNGLVLPIQLTTDERKFLVLAVGAISLLQLRAERQAVGITNDEADQRTAALVEQFVEVALRVDHIGLMRKLS